MALTKKALASRVADSCSLNKGVAETVVNAIFFELADSLHLHDDVDINGFGKFTAVRREARKGRNPATGETINLPAKWTVKFKASKTLKDAVEK